MKLKQQLYDLLSKHKAKVQEAQTAVEAGDLDKAEALTKEAQALSGDIERLKTLVAESERYGGSEPPEGDPVPHPGLHKGEPEDGYQKAVKTFAQAARDGFPRQKAAGDMMQEGVDADGGYTVPQDIVTKIIDLRDAKESLLDEVRVIPVTAKSGKRVFKKRGQHAGFATVAEAAKFGKTATPQFTTMAYEVKKRGGYLPVTNELLEDSDNNIVSVVQEWLGDESRVTANKEILAVVQSKAAETFDGLDGIIRAWIGLGSTFRATSRLYTNDDGLAWLATLKDANGRYLLSPNPADPKRLQICAGPYILPVKTYDNSTLPPVGGKIPVILGDLKEGVVYWDRRQFTVRVSDTAVVGDFNAFEQDMTIWRGSLRDDCTAWDDAAFVYGTVALTAGNAADVPTGGGTPSSDVPTD